ncbi:MAG: hypothetical protein GEU90_10995 [Gemmatimonas sp.]|nr:hypothetical protein [Gemmatimonas sp.]
MNISSAEPYLPPKQRSIRLQIRIADTLDIRKWYARQVAVGLALGGTAGDPGEVEADHVPDPSSLEPQLPPALLDHLGADLGRSELLKLGSSCVARRRLMMSSAV